MVAPQAQVLRAGAVLFAKQPTAKQPTGLTHYFGTLYAQNALQLLHGLFTCLNATSWVVSDTPMMHTYIPCQGVTIIQDTFIHADMQQPNRAATSSMLHSRNSSLLCSKLPVAVAETLS